MDAGKEMEKLKFLLLGTCFFLLSCFKSCETLQYKFAGKEVEGTVIEVSEHRHSRIGNPGPYARPYWKVVYKVTMPTTDFVGSMQVSTKSALKDYPIGKKLKVLVIHEDRPFPSSVIKGHETSFWFYSLIVMAAGSSIWVIRILRSD